MISTIAAGLIAALGAAILAGWAYLKHQVSVAKKETEQAKEESAEREKALDTRAKVSADANNQAVSDSNTAKEAINVQAQADAAAVTRTDDVGLQDGAGALADAVKRANGGV